MCGGAVYVFARWLARRTALRDFARAHALQYRGVLPSHKYVPYTQFYSIRSGVLLYNAMEGIWDGFAIALFDVPLRGGPGTSAIVTVPHDCTQFEVIPDALNPPRTAIGQRSGNWSRVTLPHTDLPGVVVREATEGSAAEAIGPRTVALIRDGLPARLETNCGYLLVNAVRVIAPDDLPGFLRFATAAARALQADRDARYEA